MKMTKRIMTNSLSPVGERAGVRGTSLAILLSVASAACQYRVEPAVVPDPPKVTTFTASPGEVAAGAMVTLSWNVENATKVSISELASGAVAGVDDAASGSVQVAAGAESPFWVLTAENSRGVRATAVASVLVQGAAAGLLFEALPELAGPNEPAMLVWSAPGARSVTITDGAGAMVNLNGQVNAGSVMVNPVADTTYTLNADGRTATAAVARTQAITELTVTPLSARPGETVTIAWKTTNATRVTLTSPGLGTLANETDAAKVASSSVMQVIPQFDMQLGVPFVLRAEGKGEPVQRTVTVYLSSTPTMLTATAPEFSRTGTTFPLAWTTRGADQVRVSAGGVVLHVGPAQGSVDLPTPSVDTDYSVVAVQSATGETSAPLTVTVKPVGLPTVVTFTADRSTIAQGGDPVVLTWNVTSARNVSITEEGRGTVLETSGTAAATGMLTVYPNQPTTRYVLEADNAAGDSIVPQTLPVTVTNVATLTFSRKAPIGANAQVTGSTVPNGGPISGLFTSRLNPPGAQFIDISTNGTPVTFSNADTGYQNLDIGTFSTVLFGQRVSGLKLNIAVNGWMAFSNTSTGGPTTPAAIGTALYPWALAPFYANLRAGPTSSAQWRIDTVAGERRLIVQWNDFEEQVAQPQASLTFQVQVYSSGRVVFAYREVQNWSLTVNTGIVNGDETSVLSSPVPPATGQVVEFFGEAVLPAPVKVTNAPAVGFVKMPQGSVRVEGDPRLAPNTLIITEANPRPLVAQGEWVEIANFGTEAQDISGWQLRTDAGTVQTLPSPLVVQPGARVVVSESAGANDGLTVDGVYGGRVSLPDGGGGTLTLGLDGVAVSHVNLSTLPFVTSALQADPPAPWLKFTTTAFTQLTCGTDAGYGMNGQLGTPGAAHARCFPYELTDGGAPFVSIAATGAPLILGSNAASDESVLTLDPGVPVKIGHTTVPRLYVSTNGFISPTLITNASSTNKTTPSTSSPGPGTIAPFWDFLMGSTEPGSGIYWEVRDVGTPNESLIVSWEKWRYDSTTYLTSLNFQARFWASGDITFAYGDLTLLGGTTTAYHLGYSATVWLEDPSGRAAALFRATSGSSTGPFLAPNSTLRFAFTP